MQNQITNNWQLKKLTELGELNRGRSRHRPRDAKILYGGPYPFIQTGDVKASNGRITLYTQTYSEEGLKQSRMWPADTICITIAANIADLGKLTFPACFPDSVIGFLADKEKSDPDFILYSLQYLKRNIRSYAIGSAQDNINLGTFENVLIPTPNLPEQKKIARALSTLDDKVEVNNKIAKTLEEMTQALFKEWFVKFKFPSHKKVEFVDSEPGKIPKGWVIGNLSDLITLGRAIVNPQECQSEKFIHYSLPAFDNNQEQVVEFGREIMSNKFLLPNICILISKLNPKIPRLWLINDSKNEFRKISSTEFIVIVPKTENNLNFVYIFLQSNYFQNIFQNRTTGTSTSHQRVKPDDLMNIPLAIPPQNILLVFDRTISKNMEIIGILKKENQKLAAIRDLLLPKLMRGEISL